MQVFIEFLIGYTCEGHTTTDELNDKLHELTKAFVSTLPFNAYFTRKAVKHYLEMLNDVLSNDLKRCITLRFDEKRYTNLLVAYLQRATSSDFLHQLNG